MNLPSHDPLDEVFGPSSNGAGPSPTPVVPPQTQPKKRTLLDIGRDMAMLDDLVEEMGGDVSDPQVERIIDQWFEDLQSNLKGKVDNYCAFITELEARADTRKKEKQRLERLQKSDETLADRLRDRLRYFMQGRSLTKLDTERYRVSVRRNGGRAPLTYADGAEPAAVDAHFHKVEYKFNTDTIRDALDRGIELDFARYGERGSSLQIK